MFPINFGTALPRFGITAAEIKLFCGGGTVYPHHPAAVLCREPFGMVQQQSSEPAPAVPRKNIQPCDTVLFYADCSDDARPSEHIHLPGSDLRGGMLHTVQIVCKPCRDCRRIILRIDGEHGFFDDGVHLFGILSACLFDLHFLTCSFLKWT